MSLIEIAICDDEKISLNVVSAAVETILQENGETACIEKFSSSGDLADRLNSKKFDLLLLDIEMPQLSGIELAGELRAEKNQVKIIYVSNRTDKVFETFPTAPFGFVRKNNLVKDLTDNLKRFLISYGKADCDVLLLKKRFGNSAYSFADIMYVEGKRNAQILYLSDGTTDEVYSSLEYLYEKLNDKGFYRVQRGYIVNFRYIKSFITGRVQMKNGVDIAVSRGKLFEIKRAYMAYMQSNNILIH